MRWRYKWARTIQRNDWVSISHLPFNFHREEVICVYFRIFTFVSSFLAAYKYTILDIQLYETHRL